VEVGQCPAEEARLLGIRTGAPLLVLRSTMYDPRGQPVEHGIAHQRGDRARIVIDVIPK
jgi:DNA-binding GntR family transcriptional regulator